MPQTLVVIVTRNNPALLEHALQKYQKHPPGTSCDYLIVDASSDDPKQLQLLERQQLGGVLHCANDRVECNYNQAYRNKPGYDFYFFCHDDNVPIADNWLRPFLERLQSGYVEPECPPEYRDLPIGRVGGLCQFWRFYDSVKGYPVSSTFLEPCVKAITRKPAPKMYKYADCDRVLISAECLQATKGFVTLRSYEEDDELFSDLCMWIQMFLHYPDEGMYPKTRYPPGGYWNRLTLLSEFMNSVLPLTLGYRTVGVEGDGFLEQIHGFDEPWANRFVAHYGGPNSLAALAKHFGGTPAQMKERMADRAFLIKAYNYFRSYYA